MAFYGYVMSLSFVIYRNMQCSTAQSTHTSGNMRAKIPLWNSWSLLKFQKMSNMPYTCPASLHYLVVYLGMTWQFEATNWKLESSAWSLLEAYWLGMGAVQLSTRPDIARMWSSTLVHRSLQLQCDHEGTISGPRHLNQIDEQCKPYLKCEQ